MQVHEAVEQVLAEEFVRLQGSTFQQLLNASQAQAQMLSAAIDPIAQEAYESWTGAAETSARFLYGLLRVNPDRPLADLIAQPDTQAALRRPFERATDETRQAISEAWQEGAAQGLTAANQDLQIAGMDPVGPAPLNQGPLAQLLDDAGANGDAAYQRFLNAIQTNNPEVVRDAVRNVGQDQALRARAGADVAGKSAANEEKVQAFQQAADEQGITIRKVWRARLDLHNVCKFCKNLHGATRKLDQSFTWTAWSGPLLRPPRHPNCRCYVVLHLSSFANEDGPTPASMRQMAQEWWDQHNG